MTCQCDRIELVLTVNAYMPNMYRSNGKEKKENEMNVIEVKMNLLKLGN